MIEQAISEEKETKQQPEGITAITVCGFKSISREQRIEIRPLTILAGANSSGKSSMIQPLLLLKQTLEASYDPGPLLLNGPNVRFTSTDQLLSCINGGNRTDTFYVGVEHSSGATLTTYFSRQPGRQLDVKQMIFADEKESTLERPELHVLRAGMTHDEINSTVPPYLKDFGKEISKDGESLLEWVVTRNRCFLGVGVQLKTRDDKGQFPHSFSFPPVFSPTRTIELYIRQITHLPGLRGNPERTYPTTAVGSTFPGTFENYVASVITQWQTAKDKKLELLDQALETLRLTWKVVAKTINETQVELQVGRLPSALKGRKPDLVSIGDVGFGVSQALPVLVALIVAEPGQMVYLEQPELHLHPRAQRAMAKILADAAKRGVRVVAETHSDLLLRGIQTEVAKGDLPRELVKLHWFERQKDGSTKISSRDLDEHGAYGDWPADFDDVALEAESDYLDAAEASYKR